MDFGTILDQNSCKSMMIDLARDFSPYPAGRFSADGQYSGEAFREDKLVPALEKLIAGGSDEKLVINIDGVRAFGSSFLEEAFGGLLRLGLFSKEEVLRRIDVQSTKPNLSFYKNMILDIIRTTPIPTR
nr:STAS-like domain-containing protein [Brucella anthropi]